MTNRRAVAGQCHLGEDQQLQPASGATGHGRQDLTQIVLDRIVDGDLSGTNVQAACVRSHDLPPCLAAKVERRQERFYHQTGSRTTNITPAGHALPAVIDDAKMEFRPPKWSPHLRCR